MLRIDVPAGAVDVNVHPTKIEVRFAQPDRVYGSVLRAVRGSLAAAIEPPGAKTVAVRAMATPPVREAPALSAPGGAPGIREALVEYARRTDAGAIATPSDRRPSGSRAPAATPLPPLPGLTGGVERARRFADLRVIGQALRGYIVCEGDDVLVLIDQHAAHERVRFERLRGSERPVAGYASQRLLVPRVAEVGAAVRERLDEIGRELADAGFEIEPFGPSAVAVRAAGGARRDDRRGRAPGDLARDLDRLGTTSERLAAARDALLARIACHGAVRAGDPLTLEEMQRAVAAPTRFRAAATCPHGRPLLFEIGRSELARRVGRT